MISNTGYYTENISFFDYHLQPLDQVIKSYINIKNSQNRSRSLPKLPVYTVLFTTDILLLYPNIRHDEGLSSVRKRLEN